MSRQVCELSFDFERLTCLHTFYLYAGKEEWVLSIVQEMRNLSTKFEENMAQLSLIAKDVQSLKSDVKGSKISVSAPPHSSAGDGWVPDG
jgi:hypothetical protein